MAQCKGPDEARNAQGRAAKARITSSAGKEGSLVVSWTCSCLQATRAGFGPWREDSLYVKYTASVQRWQAAFQGQQLRDKLLRND